MLLLMKKALIVVAIFLADLSTFAYAEQPLDALQKSIEKSISILNDPIYRDTTQKDAQRQRLWEILNQIFDFKEFSRRVLAANWLKFTPQQRKEFTALFAKFVKVYYLTRLQDKYNNEKVIYVNQNIISYSKAVVQVRLLWKNQEVLVEIKMVRRVNSWKIYDIVALGISGVRFYRVQFHAILLKESPAQVIERLKEKISKIEEKLEKK
jgi:phospholipid transport system substrate-binding protein